MSKDRIYQGRVVTVVEVNGGWTTVLDGMKQLKVRNGELSAVPVNEVQMPAKPGPLLSRTARADAGKRLAAAQGAAAAAARKAKAAARAEQETPAGALTERLVTPDLAKYTVSDVKTASGRRAIDINDEVAASLRGKDLDETYREASTVLGVSVKELKAKYGHLNPGMQRMNLGNRLRGAASAAAREASA